MAKSLTLQHIYIYIYLSLSLYLVSVSLFGLWRGTFCTTLKGDQLYHILGAHFRTTNMRVFEDFCVKSWSQLVLLGFRFSSIGHLFGFLVLCLTSTNPSFKTTLAKNNLKHYKIGFLKVSMFQSQSHEKPANECVTKICTFSRNSCFYSSQTAIFLQESGNSGFEKCRFCARFGGVH